MNTKTLHIVLILVVSLAVLAWLRSDGHYDFDVRSVIPFMRGEVTLHDWAGVVLIVLGIWGTSLLQARPHRVDEPPDEDYDVLEDSEPDNDWDTINDENDEEG